MQRVPLVVNVNGKEFRVRPSDLALNVDWRGAVAEAQGETDGFRPIRGFRRLAVWAFGTDVTPSASVDPRALARVLQPMTRGDVAHRDAAIRLIGLRPVVVPEKDGRRSTRRRPRRPSSAPSPASTVLPSRSPRPTRSPR